MVAVAGAGRRRGAGADRRRARHPRRNVARHRRRVFPARGVRRVQRRSSAGLQRRHVGRRALHAAHQGPLQPGAARRRHPRHPGSRRMGRGRRGAVLYRRRPAGAGVSGASSRRRQLRSIRRRRLRREGHPLLRRRVADLVEGLRGDPHRGSRDLRGLPDPRGRSVRGAARRIGAPHRTRVPPRSPGRPFRHQDQRHPQECPSGHRPQ